MFFPLEFFVFFSLFEREKKGSRRGKSFFFVPQDGVAVTAIERIEALEALPELTGELVEVERQDEEKGGDGGENGDSESDSSSSSSETADLRNLEREADLLEERMKQQQQQQQQGAAGGGEEEKMPWSRAARLLLARETAAEQSGGSGRSTGRSTGGKAAAATTAATSGSLFDQSSRNFEPLRTSMPPWPSLSSSDEDEASSGEEGEREEEKRGGRGKYRCQCDDGSWPFALFPSAEGSPSIVFEVALGPAGKKGGGIGEVELDVRTRHARVFANGSLLCVRLPGKVDPGAATAKRSLASGKLVVEMPLADPDEELDEACIREWKGGGRGRESFRKGGRAAGRVAVAAAAVVVAEEEMDEDSDGDGSSSPPPL